MSFFNFISGTSTGSLIAFALVGGMSVNEVTECYKTIIPLIFKKSQNGRGVVDFLLSLGDKLTKAPITPYTQDVMKDVAQIIFGPNSETSDIKSNNGCLAGAVARQFNQGGNHDGQPEHLELFDSLSEPPQPTVEVLLGSSAAPIYFEIPRKIGFRGYIDGGVTGMKF